MTKSVTVPAVPDEAIACSDKKTSEATQSGKTARDFTFDNARFGMLVIIAHGHFYMLDSWNYYGGHLISGAFTWSNTLSAFAFLSGAMSKEPPSAKKMRSLFTCVLMPATFFVLLDKLLLGILLKGLDFGTAFGQGLSGTIHAGKSIHWYLQSLVLWRLCAFAADAIGDVLHTPGWPWLCGLCAMVSLVSPFHQVPEIFSLPNACFYFPCFVIGLYFPLKQLLQLVPSTMPTQLTGLTLLVAWVWVYDNTFVGYSFQSKDFYANKIAHGQCLERFTWCEALWNAEMSIPAFLVVLVSACPRSAHRFITHAGADGAMYVYLLHWPVLNLYMHYATTLW
jgi:hypothetical protein